MLNHDRSGRAAAAVVLLLLILALIAYGVYWYSQNQLPKMLSQKAKLATTQNQPGARKPECGGPERGWRRGGAGRCSSCRSAQARNRRVRRDRG